MKQASAMRILHLADIHIGVENYSRPASQADLDALPDHFAPGDDRQEYLGFPTRLLDFLAAFDEAVRYALTSDVDLVLFAGDAYKSRNPSQTHQREFARRIARLASEGGIPVFLLTGNHDLPHTSGRATTLEIFPVLAARNVYVGDNLATHLIPTSHGPIQVVSLPWIRRSAFLARDETRNLTLEQITRELETRLTHLLSQQIEALDPSLPAILCAHVTLSSAKLSSERTMMLGQDHVLHLSDVANPAFDYVALGHIHRHQVLSHSPPVAYSGSLQRVDFGEEKEDKGFCVVELDPSQPRGQRIVGLDFIPVHARPFLTIDVRVQPGQDPTEATRQAILRRAVAGAVVRLRVEMPSEALPAFREQEARDTLKEAHHIAAIVAAPIISGRRTRLGPEMVEGLSPKEALRKYLEVRNTPHDRAEVLLRHADRLIHEEVEGPSG